MSVPVQSQVELATVVERVVASQVVTAAVDDTGTTAGQVSVDKVGGDPVQSQL